MNYEEKLAMIESSGLPEEKKAMMRQMITLGDEVHQEASAYIQAEYGLDEAGLEGVKAIGGTLLMQFGENLILGLEANESLSGEDRRRIVGAVMDYVKITMRAYWKAKKAAGLSED